MARKGVSGCARCKTAEARAGYMDGASGPGASSGPQMRDGETSFFLYLQGPSRPAGRLERRPWLAPAPSPPRPRSAADGMTDRRHQTVGQPNPSKPPGEPPLPEILPCCCRSPCRGHAPRWRTAPLEKANTEGMHAATYCCSSTRGSRGGRGGGKPAEMWYEYPDFVWGLLVAREFCHCSSFFWLRGAAPPPSLRALGRSRSHMFGIVLGVRWSGNCLGRPKASSVWVDEAPGRCRIVTGYGAPGPSRCSCPFRGG